jgi:DNA-binding XRE family transcriptional regulator
VFKNIERIIFDKGLKKRDIAKALGISYNTFLLKLKGEYYFTLDEAIKLKEILETDLTVEELFKTAA